MREYYAFRLQQCANEGETLILGGGCFSNLLWMHTCVLRKHVFDILETIRMTLE